MLERRTKRGRRACGTPGAGYRPATGWAGCLGGPHYNGRMDDPNGFGCDVGRLRCGNQIFAQSDKIRDCKKVSVPSLGMSVHLFVLNGLKIEELDLICLGLLFA